MNIYYLSNFNNYYNRQLKNYSTRKIDDFSDFVIYTESNKNFNPNDNVRTALTVNIADDIDIDYLLTSEDNVNIVSKWYVIEKTRNRKGQWMLDLRRDLLADYFEEISSSPIFFEKGYITNRYNKLIYNNENILVNQIKQKEVLIKDKTNTPWIVGYLGKNYYQGLTNENGNYYCYFESNNLDTPSLSGSYSELSALGNVTADLAQKQYLRLILERSQSYYGLIMDQKKPYLAYKDRRYTPNNSIFVSTEKIYDDLYVNLADGEGIFNAYFNNCNFTYGQNMLSAYISKYITNIDYYKSISNVIIKNTDTEGPKYFKIFVTDNGYSDYVITPSAGSALYNDIVNRINSDVLNKRYVDGGTDKYLSSIMYYDPNGANTLQLTASVKSYTISAREVVPSVRGRALLATTSVDKVITKKELSDAPYIMFCAPYYDAPVRRNSGVVIQYGSDGNVNREFATALATNLGSTNGYIYDLQILPFCPIPEIYNSSGEIDLTNIDTRSYSIITIADASGAYTDLNNKGILLFPTKSSFRDIITLSNDDRIAYPSDITEIKVKNDTEFCRLVSPNYAGAFEFNPMKNGGLSQIEINCTYKPFQPYIHINPFFNSGFLYGGDFNDNRGLICGGNFSMPQTSDAWINYQIQNKSYMESFNRQIENMDINNSVQRERELWSATTGTISGTISGIAGGAMTGGIPGAIIGGAAAATGNVLGAMKDLELNDKLRAEGIDYTKDMFGYTLQNIKALPNTLSRVSSFDIDNKYFPFIEYYACSEDEKNAYENKLKYNGMTIMSVGLLDEFTDYNNRYIKGKLVRLLDASGNPFGEYHEAVEIAAELAKGVFI